MNARLFALFCSAISLSGCQTTQKDNLIWVRTDGQMGSNNPALRQQHQIDWIICVGEVQKAAAGAPLIYFSGIGGAISAAILQSDRERAYLDIAKGCMAPRGYMLVPESQAAAISASFRKHLKAQ